MPAMADAAAQPLGSRVRWLLAIPLLLAVVAYARVLHGEFQFDDNLTILESTSVKDLPGALEGLGRGLFGFGRPVTDLTFALNYAAGATSTFGFHLVNLAVHLTVVVLLFLLTRRVLRLAGAAAPGGLSLVVAGLFALHPLQSEAVSYITQRAESLASGLYVAALLLLLEAERRGRSARGVAAYLLGLLAFLLGLGAKVILVTLPAAHLLLVAMVPDEKGKRELTSWPRRCVLLVPWLALDAWFTFATLRGLEGHKDAGFGVPGAPPGLYLLTQCRAVATYLRLLLWPAGQNVDWHFPFSRSLAEPAVWPSAAVLLALAAGAFLLWRGGRRPGAAGASGRVAAFGLAWFFLVLAPTSSFVALKDALAEHRVYLASWGIFVAAAASGERLLSRLEQRRRLAVTVALAAVAWGALGVALYRRNAVWETAEALWRDALAKNPTNWRGRMYLVRALRANGQPAAALQEYRRALESLAPDPTGLDPLFDADVSFFVDVVRDAPRDPRLRLDLADVLRAQQSPERAIDEYQAALALMGDDPRWARLRSEASNRLGSTLLDVGRGEEAQAVFRAALARDPRNAEAAGNLAALAFERQDLGEAESLALRAISLDPASGLGLQVLGTIRMLRGDHAGALQSLGRAVEADPTDGLRRFNLGLAYDAAGRRDDACAAWREVREHPGARATSELLSRVRRAEEASRCPGSTPLPGR